MPAQIIKTRARFFVAVEGESEQSFVTWLQVLSQKELYGRNKSADTLKCFASVRTCASVNRRSPRRIIAPSVR
jgi:hypothetical protein